ncbi:MAG TPA: hypothetical protein PK052_01225 [Anaerohalosphaeraceae bacterium]|nr:hypothetical protein [Phycisphaerae bacterium]HOK94704.1 hypothetical protein [Anaerohalosphaeraceae bacterium]HOL30578.1 hypothetical protein [Anaerohalosphaeraceae bacterium]HPC63601.1 hypothetical protein [Anaerohalosphaeraceae bacterium]HPO68855.1 hypothetical protein [Anaerohalosphaeraceae bacterium]
MSGQTSSAEKPKPSNRRVWFIVWGLVSIAGLAVLILFGIPLFLSSAGGTQFLLSKINQSVDGKVQMDDFSIGWFKGIHLTNLSYADNAGMASVKVRRLETQPQYWALLGGKINLGKTLIEGPDVYVKIPAVQEPAGKTQKRESGQQSATPSAFPIHQINLELVDGRATVELGGDVPQAVSFTNIASVVNLAAAGQRSMLDVSMNVVGQGEPAALSAKGQATTDKTGWKLKEGAFDVKIDKLQLASLKPLFALAGKTVDIAGVLNAEGTIAIQNNAVGQAFLTATIDNFSQGTGQQQIKTAKPITVTVSAAQQDSGIKIDKFAVASEFFNVNCSGTAEAIDYAVDADLAQTQNLIAQFADMGGLSMRGMLDLRGKVLMKEQEIKAAGKGTVRELIVRKGDVETPKTNVDALEFDCTVDQAKNQLRVAMANMTAPPVGAVKISNVVVPMGEAGEKTISADASAQIDLAKAWPFAQVFAEVPEGMQIAGLLDATLKAATAGSQMRLQSENTKVDGLKIIPKAGEPFIQDRITLKCDIVLDTEQQTIDIGAFDLKGAAGQTLISITKGEVKKKVSSSLTRISGDVEAHYDWQALSAFASMYLPEGLSVKGARKDTFHFDSEYPTDKPELMKANLNAAGSVGFDSASYFGLNFGPTDVKLNIVKGLVDLTIPQTTVNGGKLQFAGTMNLAEEPLLFRLKQPMTILDKIALNDTLSQAMLLYTSPIFANAVKTSGILSFSSQQMVLPLSGKDMMLLTLKGTFGIESLRMQAGDFLGQLLTLLNAGDSVMLTVRPTDFSVEKGVVSYKDMQVDVGNTPLHFRGKVGLDKTLTMDVEIPVDKNTVTVPIEGSLLRPKINPAKLIEKQGQQLLEKEIQRGLERIFR